MSATVAWSSFPVLFALKITPPLCNFKRPSFCNKQKNVERLVKKCYTGLNIITLCMYGVFFIVIVLPNSSAVLILHQTNIY